MSNDESAPRDGHSIGGLISVTIDPDTAQIVKIEGIDALGARHELSAEERAVLLRRRAERTLEQVVERH